MSQEQLAEPSTDEISADEMSVDVQSCIVKVAVDGAAGSGVIWRMTEDEIVIVSARHLLMRDVVAEITCSHGETMTAQTIGLSTQYDIGFMTAAADMEAELTEALQPLDISLQERTQGGERVVQAAQGESYQGEVLDYLYIPEFGTKVLRTQCYAHAGMSGGGVFDEEGWLLGMIVGGDSAGTGYKEAYVTYSLPVTLIETEYEAISANGS